MRRIKLSFTNRGDLYVRRASDDLSVWEIQGQHGGIIVKRPKLRRTVTGVFILDMRVDRMEFRRWDTFHDRTPGFEKNDYTLEHYWSR